jgi:hypothetical protein
MTAPHGPLGEFEERLLSELRQVVAERAATPSGGRPARILGWRLQLRPAAVGVVAVVALAVAAVVGLPLLRDTPAYAVSSARDGTVTVRINELRDADGLERQLERHGIPAEVDYTPAGTVCREGRYTPSPTLFRMELGQDGGRLRFAVDPRQLTPGDTVVITTSGGADAGAVGVSLARGEVLPCVPVAADFAPGGTVTDGAGAGTGTGVGAGGGR